MQVEPEKLEALTRLANSANISQSDIDQFVEHHADFKALEALRTKKSDPDSADEVLKLLEELGFGPEYLDALLNERAAQLAAVPVSLENRVCHSGRRVRTYPQVISFEESQGLRM